MNAFSVWDRVKEKATIHGESGCLISMGNARAMVLRICREEQAECPPPDALEYLASELVRLSLEARDLSEPRLRLPSTYRGEILPEGRSPSSFR